MRLATEIYALKKRFDQAPAEAGQDTAGLGSTRSVGGAGTAPEEACSCRGDRKGGGGVRGQCRRSILPKARNKYRVTSRGTARVTHTALNRSRYSLGTVRVVKQTGYLANDGVYINIPR